MKFFRIASHIPGLSMDVGSILAGSLFLFRALGILPPMIFGIGYVCMIFIVILCKMERVHLFSEHEVTMFTQDYDKGTEAMMQFYAAPGEEADFIDGLTSALFQPHPKTYRHRTLPREALRSFSFYPITSRIDLIVIELANCKMRNGQRLVPFILKNRHHVLCIFTTIGLSLRYRELLENYFANKTQTNY